MLIRILVMVEPAPLRRRIQRQVRDPHTLVSTLGSRKAFWSEMSRQTFDLLILNRTAFQDPPSNLIGTVRALPEEPEVVVLCEREDPEERAALLEAGAYAVIYEGLTDPALAGALGTLISRRREESLRHLRADRLAQVPSLRDFVSASTAMQAFMSVVYRVLPVDSSLLILGETGVGKERLARALHNEGPRSRGPFMQVNCAALPEPLLESELFGHKEGAFTGAVRTRRGCFELAHRGTIFLDEICELPVPLQAKLLQVLQDRSIRPVGSETSIDVDVRVIAATNRDIEDEIKTKRFREDLYYRLSVVSLTIPPLRERREDIPELLESYREHFCSRFGRSIGRTPEDVESALIRYPWPGNVRELINVMERAVLLCTGDEITLAELPEIIGRRPADEQAGSAPAGSPVVSDCLLPERFIQKPWRQVRKEMVRVFEKQYVAGLLRLTGGRIGETARLAGMEPRSLHEKMKRHGLSKEDFRRQDGSPSDEQAHRRR